MSIVGYGNGMALFRANFSFYRASYYIQNLTGLLCDRIIGFPRVPPLDPLLQPVPQAFIFTCIGGVVPQFFSFFFLVPHALLDLIYYLQL